MANWTEQDLKNLLEKRTYPKACKEFNVNSKAIGRLPVNYKVGHQAGRMNKLETRYAEHLEDLKAKGEILLYKFESVKFRLADKTWYTPDFWLLKSNGAIECHETKGWMLDDANVKLKTVAEQFREITFWLIRWKNGQWVKETK